MFNLFRLGRWDEMIQLLEELPDPADPESRTPFFICSWAAVFLAVHRGMTDLRDALAAPWEETPYGEDIQQNSAKGTLVATILHSRGDLGGALEAAERAFAERPGLSWGHGGVRHSFAELVECALALGDVARAEWALRQAEQEKPGHIPPAVRADTLRFRARLDALAGLTDRAEQGFKAAAGVYRELAYPFYLAVTLVDHAEWLASVERIGDAAPLLDEATTIFERLEATPWLDRLARITPRVAEHAG
jgi:hypothetical protein